MRVNKNGPEHPALGRCWDWTGSRVSTKRGLTYGLLGVNGVYERTHRFSWKLHNGPITNGLHVLHHCDRFECVNPAHLYLGTPLENNRDSSNRDRVPKGENKHSAKLTEQQVREIRGRYIRMCRKNGSEALAKEYGVSSQTIQSILSRKRWKHVI